MSLETVLARLRNEFPEHIFDSVIEKRELSERDPAGNLQTGRRMYHRILVDGKISHAVYDEDIAELKSPDGIDYDKEYEDVFVEFFKMEFPFVKKLFV